MLHTAKLLFLITILYAFQALPASNSSADILDSSCEINLKKNIISSGWFDWEPYQYINDSPTGPVLTGLDVEVTNTIAKIIGFEAKIDKVDWDQNVLGVKNGTIDMAAGATDTKDREEFAFFSDPYRFEEDSLFTNKAINNSSFNNIEEFLGLIKANDFKLGILDGVVFISDQLNNFISDPQNAGLITKSQDDLTNLYLLADGKIDGFITDKLVGSTLILKHGLLGKVHEVPLNLKTPISFMLSKKTISKEILNKINSAILSLNRSGEYQSISKEYLYPVLMLQVVNSKWFFYVSILGVISFGLSGLALAVKDNLTLLGTIFLAIIPSIAMCVTKDIILIGNKTGIVDSYTTYLIVIISIVMLGFSSVRMLDRFNKDSKQDELQNAFWTNFQIVFDSLGQSCFIIFGVTTTIVFKYTPIIIWGPIFAVLIADLGCVVRDLLTKNKEISVFSGSVISEISIIWGVVFSIFLNYYSESPSEGLCAVVAIFTLLGAFSSRLLAHYYKIPNLRFR